MGKLETPDARAQYANFYANLVERIDRQIAPIVDLFYEPDGRPTTYARALRLIEEGRVDVGALVTHRYPSLDAVPSAFAGDHRLPEYVKGVVTL